MGRHGGDYTASQEEKKSHAETQRPQRESSRRPGLVGFWILSAVSASLRETSSLPAPRREIILRYALEQANARSAVHHADVVAVGEGVGELLLVRHQDN